MHTDPGEQSRLDAALRDEQLRLYDSNVASAVGGMVLVALLVIMVLRGAVADGALIAWATAMAAVIAARLWVWRWSVRERARPGVVVRSLWLLRLAVVASGAMWGLAGAALFPEQDLLRQYFLGFVVAGMAAGSLTLTSFDPLSSRLHALVAIGPLSARLLLTGQEELQAVALMMALFVAFLFFTGMRAFRNVRDTVAMRLSETSRAEALALSEQRLQQLAEQLSRKTEALELTLDSMDQAILSLDAQGRTNFHNHRLVELLDLPEPFMASKPTMNDIARFQFEHGHYGANFELMGETARPHLQRWFAGQQDDFPPMYHRRTKEGRMLEVKTRFLGGGALVRTFTDVTEYFSALDRLRDSEMQSRKLALVAAHTDNAVVIADAEGRIEWVNEAFTRLTGYRLDEVTARKFAEVLRGPDTDATEAGRLDAELQRERHASAELLNYAKDGRTYWVAVEARAICGDDGRVNQIVTVERDISGRKQAEAALRAAHAEAERANRAKSDFLSAMSHELRTPMNAILGFAQLLATDDVQRLDARQRGQVDEILQAGRHLLALINDVLDLSRVEAGTQAMRMETVPVQDLIDECLRLLQPLAQERKVTLRTIDPAPCDCHVLADRTRLTQVMLNLLSNAIKYNHEGGQVQVACEAGDRGLRVSVADTGPGLSPEQQGQLFRAFERLGAEHGPMPGAGIGLVLSKRLVELMDGRIGVDSAPGRGATFWVEVPTAAAPAGTPAARAVQAQEDTAVPAGTHRLLYIEDNPVNLLLVEAMLAREKGITMQGALLPEAGLELAQADPPDLVLLDIKLPGMDGFEVLRRLRADARTRDIPVVAITANAMPADVDEGMAAGFDAYLTKPLDLDELLATVGRMLRR